MRLLFVTILLLISSLIIAQDTVGLRKATAALNEALLKKDAVVLNLLLENKLSYGHSNGWIQSKEDVMADFVSGKIEYKKIEAGEEIFNINPNAVTVRSITKVEGVVNGTTFNMSLQVLQVWKRIRKQWVLIARQSVKIS
jgi:hypothetical protein